MTTSERFAVLTGGPSAEERTARLAEGAEEASVGPQRGSLLTNQRFLLTVSAALMVGGVLAILLGWVGAADATVIEEQVPYLISGGLLGVALATIGALTLYAHWQTVSIREARDHEAARRRDHLELIEAIRSTAGAGTRQEDKRNGSARGAASRRSVR